MPRRKGRRLIVGALVVLFCLWIVSTSQPGRRVEGCPTGCAAPVARTPGPLRVVSLNVLHEFPHFEHLDRRIDLIAEELARIDPDIICLQEISWTIKRGNIAKLIAERLGYNYVYGRANGNRYTIGFEEGEALLSRYPLSQARLTELKPRAGLLEHRVALYAQVTTPDGILGICVTHLTTGSQEVSAGQVAALQAWVDETRGQTTAIITGDFNAQPEEAQMIALGQRWTDTALAPAGAEAPATCCVDALIARDGILTQRLDYVWLAQGTPTWQVARAQRILAEPIAQGRGWLRVSDHAGLLVELAPASDH